MKINLPILTMILCSIFANAQTDPCTNIQTISCGDSITFASNGLGDPNYNDHMPCSHNGGAVQGGQETIYSFTAPDTGYYQIEVLSASGSVVNYGWKDPISGCNNLSWDCINRTSSIGHIGAKNLNAGQTIYLIANAEDTGATTQQFVIHCAYNDCNNIQAVTCGVPIQFSSLGYGDENYDDHMPCSHNGGAVQGGQEAIYSFTAPDTGYYQIEVLSASGSVVNYGWKDPISGCNNLSWDCINRTSSIGHIGAKNLNAGQTIYLIANAEGTGATFQQFIIHYVHNDCNNIQTVTCGVPIQFSSLGYGDENYDDHMPCSHNGGAVQGGQEAIYSFTAPDTGYYQIEVLSASGSVVNYGWKDPISGCNNLSWDCINRTSSIGHIGAKNLNAGQTIYLIANAEGTGATTQQFVIHYVHNDCNSIQTVNCGVPIQFSSLGFGDENYNDHMPCSHNGGAIQGGQEVIYRLPPSSSPYQIIIAAASGGTGNYGWKYDSLGCGNTGWTCLGRTSSPTTFTLNTDTCASVLLMVNSESTVSVNHTFTVTCNACLVGITEINQETNFVFSPNPTFDKLTVALSEQNRLNSRLTISNIIGEIVYSQIISKTATLDVSNFNSGIYLVQISNEKGVSTKRFIKE